MRGTHYLILHILIKLVYILCEWLTLQNINKGSTWNGELLAMGYGSPLPAPILVVQTILSAIDLPKMHKVIQDNDTTTLIDCDDEGIHLPLLIDSLDLAL